MARIKEKIDAQIKTKIWDRDISSLGPLKSCWIKLLRLLHVLVIELSDEQLALRAMGLVYTTLLSIVPLLAVSFSVLKAFGVHTRFEIFLYYLLEPLGEKGTDLSLKIIGFVENINVGVLGSIGMAMLIYTVLSQVQKVESALNYIWGVEGTRSFEKRFSNYLSVLLVGPILIFSAVGISGSFMSSSVVQKILSIKSLGSLIYFAGRLVPYILISAAFTFVYVFLPNTKVRFTAALTGGIFSGIAWKITGMIFTSFVVSSAKYSAIYSGFSVLILSLIWLYWTWFILFVGAKVAYFQQHPELIRTGKISLSLSNRNKEKLGFLILYLIGEHFHTGKQAWGLQQLSDRLRVPVHLVREMLRRLEAAGLLVSTNEDPPSYIPSKDPGIIPIEEILDIIRSSPGEPQKKGFAAPEVDGLIDKLEVSLYNSVKGETLKDLVSGKFNRK